MTIKDNLKSQSFPLAQYTVFVLDSAAVEELCQAHIAQQPSDLGIDAKLQHTSCYGNKTVLSHNASQRD